MSEAEKRKVWEYLAQMLGEDPDKLFAKLTEDSPEGDEEWLPILI